MSPKDNQVAHGLDENVRIDPKYYFQLVVLAALKVTEQIPRTADQLEGAISILKEKWPTMYPLAHRLFGALENDKLNEKLIQIRGLSKSEFQSLNRYTLVQALLSDDRLVYSNSEPVLAEFVKRFAYMIGSGKVDSIYDPAFGFGNLVYSAFDGSKGPETELDVDETGEEVEVTRLLVKKVRGKEINSGAAQVANALGQLLGFDVDVSTENSLQITEKNPEKYHMVICEPPAGMRMDEPFLKQDWPFGRPSRGSADWAWAQVVQRSVAKGGYGLLFITSGALFHSNPSEVLIRAKMVSSGLVRAVFNLPSGMSPAHRANMSLIIFEDSSRNPKEEKILFVDMAEPVGRKGTFEFAKDLLSKIHDACDVFEDFVNGFFEREIGYSAALSINDPELMKNDMNLNPSLYVTQVVTGVNTKLSVKKDVTFVSKKVSEIANLVNEADKELSTFHVQAEFINLGDLLATGKVIQVVGMSKNDFKANRLRGVKYDADSGDRLELDGAQEKTIPYISVEDIRRPGELQQTGTLRPDAVKDENELVYTLANDVVFIKTGKPAARVDRTGGKALFSPLSVLRITEEGRKTISPEVLAFVLNGERVKKFMQGTTVGRLQIELIPIPIMDSVNIKEINHRLDLVQQLLMKSMDLNKQLHSLEQKLNQVLAGEFDGLQEER